MTREEFEKEINYKPPIFIKYMPETSKNYYRRHSLYKCFCGKEFECRKSSITYNETKSCGCYLILRRYINNKIHGHYINNKPSPTYISWSAMVRRIKTPYGNYVGLKSDPRWIIFENFLADMKERPNGTTIDRIDNDKGYFKDNCRWATRDMQYRNQKSRLDNKTGYRGVYKNSRGFCGYSFQFRNKLYKKSTGKNILIAAKEYDLKILEIMGEYARSKLNFPKDYE